LTLVDILPLFPQERYGSQEWKGGEAARRIVARFNTPVVFVSGCADSETLQRAAEVGYFAYVSKPFTERVLDSAIKMTIRKYGLEGDRKNPEKAEAS
jgi:CheY-like chemotaxis protein